MTILRLPDFPAPTRDIYVGDVQTELLCLALCQATSAIAAESGLSQQELIDILDGACVDDIHELSDVISSCVELDTTRRIGAARLATVVTKTLGHVAKIAELDADELARALTSGAGNSIDEIVHWLRLRKINADAQRNA